MPDDRRRSIVDRILGERILDTILDEIENTIRKYIDKTLLRIVKLLLVSIVGSVFIASGFIFVSVGSVTYLSELMPSWLAWGITGVVMALIGAVLLMSVRRH